MSKSLQQEQYGEIPPVSIPLVLIGGITLLLIVSAFLPSKWLGVKPPQKKAPLDFTSISIENTEEYDTNNDGDVTWKEIIESTPSGRQAAATVLQGPAPTKKDIDRLNDPSNLTASFSKNLYLASNQVEKAGEVDDATQQQIAAELIQLETNKVVSKHYLYSEIKIAPSEKKESIKAYGNSVATILDGFITSKILADDLVAIQTFTAAKDPEHVQDIEVLIKDASRVHAVILKLLALQVPPSASTYHLMTINQLTLYRDNLLNLSKVESDPVRAKIATNTYSKTVLDTLAIYKNWSEYFNTKTIIFTKGEKGYVFTVGYTLQ